MMVGLPSLTVHTVVVRPRYSAARLRDYLACILDDLLRLNDEILCSVLPQPSSFRSEVQGRIIGLSVGLCLINSPSMAWGREQGSGQPSFLT